MRRDAIMEEFWIFQASEYARFLHKQALHKVLKMPEYGLVDLGHLFNFSSVTQEKEAPQVNILEILKPFFPKSGHFFWFKKGQRRPPLSP